MEIKPIRNYQGYFVSDTGKIFCNLGQGNRDRTKTQEMYEIKPRFTKNGYARIYARNDMTGKRKDLYIHRLVAESFLPNLDGKSYINHKNCRRDDNRAENLEWTTAKENTDYTMSLNHVKRDELGRYVSNFTYIQ